MRNLVFALKYTCDLTFKNDELRMRCVQLQIQHHSLLSTLGVLHQNS